MDDEFSIAELIEKTIRKVGSKYCVFSKKSGKNLGCATSHEGAVKRLRQVEFFKRQQKSLTEDGIAATLEDGSLYVSDEELKSFFEAVSKSIIAEDFEDGTQNCSLVDEAKRNYLHYKSLFEEVKHLPGEHDQQSHAGKAVRLGVIGNVGQLLDSAAAEFAKVKVDENWLDMQNSSDVLTRSVLVDIVEFVAKQSDVKITSKDAQNIVDYSLKGIGKWTTRMKDFMGRGASDYPEPWTWRGDINDDELKNSLAEQLKDYSEEKSTALHADTGVKTELELAKRDRDIRGRHNAWSPEADKNIPPEDTVGNDKKELPTEKIIDAEQKHTSSDPSLSNDHRRPLMRDIIGQEVDKKVLEVRKKWRSNEDAARDAMKAEEDYERFLDKANKRWGDQYAELVKFITRIDAGESFGDDEYMDTDDRKAEFVKGDKFAADVRKGYGLKLFAERVGAASDLMPIEIAGVEKMKEKPRIEHLEEFEKSVKKHFEKHLLGKHDQQSHAGVKGAAGKVSHTPAQLREAAARQHAKDTGMSLAEARGKVGSGMKVPTTRVQTDARVYDNVIQASLRLEKKKDDKIFVSAGGKVAVAPTKLHLPTDIFMNDVWREVTDSEFQQMSENISGARNEEKSDVVAIVSEVIKSIKK